MENSEKWLKKAKTDLKIATTCEKDDEDDYLVSMYHLQQVVEKSMKAVLVHYGQDVPRTHNLSSLRAASEPFVESFPTGVEEAMNLTWFEANGRYPLDSDDNIYPEEFEEYVNISTRFYEWAASILYD